MKSEQCARCQQTGYPGWLKRHRLKPHYQCPRCPRAMINLKRHLSWHYWQEIEPMIHDYVANAPLVPDTAPQSASAGQELQA